MTIRTAQRAATAAALTLTAAMALTACGGSSDSDVKAGGTTAGAGSSQAAGDTGDAAVYQFNNTRVGDSEDETPFVTTKDSIIIKMPDELKAAIPDGSRVAIDTFTLTPQAFSTGICRLDVAIDYAGGGKKALTSVDPYGEDEGPASNLLVYMIDHGLETNGGDKVVDKVPSNDQVEEGSTYVTKDMEHITFVNECSDDNEDDIFELTNPYIEQDSKEAGNDKFASVDIAMVSGGGQSGGAGTTTIITGGTAADVSIDGKWKQPTEED
ncbi:hypothetical protein [Spelaeicoccus albus]|uniref:Lipoprotein n=1 Tax=Spelaeicoccus albus TaxID=1280376 RepID=A0A7Z0D1E0_9MICO|nr:hypothetical protein [Spelaeicoccus albus]NYI66102.1 hypothetical protein [Spelaeicoccus albus]